MSTEIFGQLNSEKAAIENEQCRQIVNEVLNFGVSQRQLMNIIYLLSLNIENVEVMQELSAAVKTLTPYIFVSSLNEDSEEQNGKIQIV